MIACLYFPYASCERAACTPDMTVYLPAPGCIVSHILLVLYKNTLMIAGLFPAGVMCARGILANPGMFAGHDRIPPECITEYLFLALALGGSFVVHRVQLQYMIAPHISKAERIKFSDLRCALHYFLCLAGMGRGGGRIHSILREL